MSIILLFSFLGRDCTLAAHRGAQHRHGRA